MFNYILTDNSCTFHVFYVSLVQYQGKIANIEFIPLRMDRYITNPNAIPLHNPSVAGNCSQRYLPRQACCTIFTTLCYTSHHCEKSARIVRSILRRVSSIPNIHNLSSFHARKENECLITDQYQDSLCPDARGSEWPVESWENFRPGPPFVFFFFLYFSAFGDCSVSMCDIPTYQ